MRLTLHEATGDHAPIYQVEGLPPGENAKIAEFNQSWRILRWNDDWHGNWTGNYASAEAALAALRDEILSAVA